MASITHTLYHNKFSVCSLMIRYAIALRGPSEDASSQILIHEQDVDIFHEEQLSEHFLCEINAKGQVPVVCSPSLDKPIADSLDITQYLSTFYPSLIPTSHKERVTKGLQDLHALNYLSLLFPGRDYVAQGFKAAVVKRLGGEISERYREALNYKLGIIERDKIGGLKAGIPEAMTERARLLLEEFQSLLPGAPSSILSNGASRPWLLGLTQRSALDAHLITFIARMRDVSREEIVPEALGRYVDAAMERDEWRDMMQGWKTMVAP